MTLVHYVGELTHYLQHLSEGFSLTTQRKTAELHLGKNDIFSCTQNIFIRTQEHYAEKRKRIIPTHGRI